jgi:hypothetical protein
MSTSKAEHNAVEFGHHVNAPGWYNGLLVACSVVSNPNLKLESGSEDKLSIHLFAKEAHQNDRTVKAYLEAWAAAVEDGHVAPATDLKPTDAGAGLDFDPEIHTEALWLYYFDAAMESFRQANRVQDAKRGRTRATPTAVVEAIKSDPVAVKGAIAEAIKADPAVAIAAREAIAERDRTVSSRKAAADSHGKQESPMDQFVNLHIQLRSAKRALSDALGFVLDMRGITDTDEVRAAVSGYVGQLRHILDLIDEGALGKSLEDELAELLEDEDLK